jgi:aminopeptidase N
VAAAEALGAMRSEKAQAVLIQALEELDPTQFSRVRAAIAGALGKYQAPQQAELAQHSAQALRTLLERGDVSYRVESAAAHALGKTRVEGSVDLLTKLIERPSWMYVVQRGILSGLAETGEDRVVDTIAAYLSSPQSYPTLRSAAVAGMRTVGHNKHLYSEDARQRAVTALSNALEHDSWEPVRAGAAWALMALSEKRAIGTLEAAASRELESFVQRAMRVAAHTLRSSGKDDEQLKSLRKDLDELREENRKLKEQLGALEARLR